MRQWIVMVQRVAIGPYRSQAAATRIANKLKNGAYTQPLLSWADSYPERYFIRHRALSDMTERQEKAASG